MSDRPTHQARRPRAPGRSGPARPRLVTTRNAQFQTWQALLTNRQKRQRLGRFLIQGVRPITVAADQGWPLDQLLHPAGRRLSAWARELLDRRPGGAEPIAVAPELLAELGERDSESASAPELIAVGAVPPDDLGRIPADRPDFLGVVFDRPTQPGNIGTLIRSADALGAHGLVVTGHSADVYDPKSVRASTGSLLRLPAVRTGAPAEVGDWVRARRAAGVPLRIVGTDEDGDTRIDRCDLTGPVLLVVGNETAGMSRAWRELCDETVSIPIGGAASSLNAANAATLALYEAARQRGFPGQGAD